MRECNKKNKFHGVGKEQIWTIDDIGQIGSLVTNFYCKLVIIKKSLYLTKVRWNLTTPISMCELYYLINLKFGVCRIVKMKRYNSSFCESLIIIWRLAFKMQDDMPIITIDNMRY